MKSAANEINTPDQPDAKPRAPKILIAEDNDDLREMLAYLIHSIGLQGHFAVNGEDAFEIINSALPNTFDIVLSDIEMPKMNGFDFLVKLRKHNFQQPFIFMTASATREVVRRAQELGIEDVLEKPFDLEKLKERLGKILNQR